MADYFGYNKTCYGPGNIVSTSMVLVKIDNSPVRLAQSCNIEYKRTMEPKFELGSDSVWLIAGHSSGSCTIDRAVGDVKLLQPYKPGSACDTQTITIAKGSEDCGMEPGTVTCTNSLLVQVGVTAAIQGLSVTDNAQWAVGLLSTT